MDLIKYIRTSFSKRFDRPKLTSDQLAFLQGLIPFGILIQEQTFQKGYHKTVNGLYASLIIADLICRSDWGRNKVSEKESNLALLKKEDLPKVKCSSKKYNDIYYRTYDSWFDFAIDMSDHYTNSGLYDNVLKEASLDLQIDNLNQSLSLQKVNLYDSIERVIADYGLIEFDSQYKR